MGRIAVIVAVLAGVATIAGVAWTIFNQPNTAMADYRQEVLAACVSIRSTMNHSYPADAVTFAPGGDVVTNKRRFVAAVGNDFGLIRTALTNLNDRPFPSELTSDRERVLTAQEEWSAAADRSIALSQQELHEGDPVTVFFELTQRAEYPTATVNLDNAMSTLAGEPCRLTEVPGS